jgi:hypothetical protein
MTTVITLDGRWGAPDVLWYGPESDNSPGVASMCCLGVAECDRGADIEEVVGHSWPGWSCLPDTDIAVDNNVDELRDKIHLANERVSSQLFSACHAVFDGHIGVTEALARVNEERREVYSIVKPLMSQLAAMCGIIKSGDEWDVRYVDMTEEEFAAFYESEWGEDLS